MNTDNTQGGAEPSLASGSSHGLTFDEWYKKEPGLKYYGDDYKGIAEAAWNAAMQQTAEHSISERERKAIKTAIEWLTTLSSRRREIRSADLLLQDARTLRGLLDRLK